MNLQEELKALKERISELEERVKDEREFPQYGDAYWFIDSTGEVINKKWEGLSFEIERLEFGNIFKTKEQVEFGFEKLKVEAELRKFSRPFENGKFNYYIFFYIDGDDVEVGYKRSCCSQGAIYFESEEKAQQAIESVGEERIKKYIFGVED